MEGVDGLALHGVKAWEAWGVWSRFIRICTGRCEKMLVFSCGPSFAKVRLINDPRYGERMI
jgi:hypothetical protein